MLRTLDPCPPALPASGPLQRVKEANPGAGIGDIAKLLGAEWKALTAEEKAPYEERARADKVGHGQAVCCAGWQRWSTAWQGDA